MHLRYESPFALSAADAITGWRTCASTGLRSSRRDSRPATLGREAGGAMASGSPLAGLLLCHSFMVSGERAG